MKNIFFFDLDGTLWDSRCHIPESTKTAIRLLHENGQYACICTGRTKAFLNVPELMELPFDGAVYGCGTHVEYGGKQQFCAMLDTERVRKIVNGCAAYNLQPILEGPDYMYLGQELTRDRFMQEYMEQYFHEAESAYDDVSSIRIQKATCMHTPKSDYLQFDSDLSADFTVIARSQLSEIVPKGYSKATGIRYLLEMLQLDTSAAYAFGDSENDLQMLEYVGHGIAMGNSPESVKRIAADVTDDVNCDGIYNALKKMEFI